MTLTWKEPAKPNGYIQNYTIYDVTRNKQIQTTGSVLEQKIDGLIPGKKISINNNHYLLWFMAVLFTCPTTTWAFVKTWHLSSSIINVSFLHFNLSLLQIIFWLIHLVNINKHIRGSSSTVTFENYIRQSLTPSKTSTYVDFWQWVICGIIIPLLDESQGYIGILMSVRPSIRHTFGFGIIIKVPLSQIFSSFHTLLCTIKYRISLITVYFTFTIYELWPFFS